MQLIRFTTINKCQQSTLLSSSSFSIALSFELPNKRKMENSQIWFGFGTFVSTFASEEVVVLTKENFDKEARTRCGHCKKLAPEYEWVGTSFKRDKSVLIGKVDCDKSKSLCTKYGVSSYPTIKWFPKGSLEPMTYEGVRTAEALTGFVNWKGGTKVKFIPSPSYVVVLSDDNFDETVFDHSKHVLVEYYSPRCGHCEKLAPDYEKLANAYKMEEDVVIAKLNAEKHKDLADRYDIDGYPTLKFFPKHNKDGEDYDGELDLEDFILFINEHCGTRRDSNGKLTFDAGIVESLHLLVKDFVSGSIDEKKENLSQILEEAEDLQGPAERYAEIYIKVAKRCIKKGFEYARKEIDHLHRVLESSISDVKADELTLKRNILSTFVA